MTLTKFEIVKMPKAKAAGTHKVYETLGAQSAALFTGSKKNCEAFLRSRLASMGV